MNKLLFGGLLVLFAVQMALAQVGQTGLSFLKLGVGARALGMGGAYSAIASDPTATYYNPASLTLAHSPQLLFMHKEWFQDTRTEFLAAATSIDNVSLGLSINSTSTGDIPIRETPGPALGTFDTHDAAIGISGAVQLDPAFSIGITGKYLYEKILVNEASGTAFDFGAWYQTPWDIRLAAAVNNVGSMSELENEAPALPTTIRLGGAYEKPLEGFDGVLTLSSDFVSITGEGKSYLNFGGELNYKNSFSIRTGYQNGTDLGSICAGVGFHYGAFEVDYAFLPTRNDFGSTHTFSLGIIFP